MGIKIEERVHVYTHCQHTFKRFGGMDRFMGWLRCKGRVNSVIKN